jgi:hypothetical protein
MAGRGRCGGRYAPGRRAITGGRVLSRDGQRVEVTETISNEAAVTAVPGRAKNGPKGTGRQRRFTMRRRRGPRAALGLDPFRIALKAPLPVARGGIVSDDVAMIESPVGARSDDAIPCFSAGRRSSQALWHHVVLAVFVIIAPRETTGGHPGFFEQRHQIEGQITPTSVPAPRRTRRFPAIAGDGASGTTSTLRHRVLRGAHRAGPEVLRPGAPVRRLVEIGGLGSHASCSVSTARIDRR